MKQDGSVTVNGSVRGNNNRITTRNYQVKNITNNSGGGKKPEGGDGRALLFGVFTIVVVAAFWYLRHFDQIFFWLKLGVVTAGVFHIAALAPHWNDPAYDWRESLLTVVGMVLVGAQGVLILTIQDALPKEALAIASRPTVATDIFAQAFEVWNRFNHTGHRLIMENIASVILLISALVLSILSGIQRLADSYSGLEEGSYCISIADRLESMKITGSLVSALFTFAGFIMISGLLSSGA